MAEGKQLGIQVGSQDLSHNELQKEHHIMFMVGTTTGTQGWAGERGQELKGDEMMKAWAR